MMNIFKIIGSTYGRTALQLVRRHERCMRTLAKFSNHLTFLTRCIKAAVIPKDLRIKSPVHTRGARRAADNASLRFLRERIFLTRLTKEEARREVISTTKKIQTTLSSQHSEAVFQTHDTIYHDIFGKCKERQQRKFSELLEPASKTKRNTTNNNWVINMSSRNLSDTEKTLLSRGMTFATVPKRIPAAEIVARVESNISKLTPEDRESLRKDIGTVLEQAKPPKSNITKDMEAALKSLKEDSTIMILPADKGRAAVILDTTTYRDKMDNLLSTGPYREIKKDPTDSLVRKLTTLLSGLKKKGSLEENTYQKLRPKRKQPPRIYGLPKIHKPAVPATPPSYPASALSPMNCPSS
nr:uncharacterized protein LOC129267565 [Lytechinus pictus]